MEHPIPDCIDIAPRPTCPHCHASLYSRGRIVDCGSFKKWADQWYCHEHGPVEPELTASAVVAQQ